MMYKLLFVAGVLFTGCQLYAQSVSYKLLYGVWQVEDRERYEEWTDHEDEGMTGRSYKIVDEKEVLIETLKLVWEDGKLTYYATVPNQNEGKSIPFVLNESVTDTLTFENFSHDFPNRIQYYPLDPERLQVLVSGASGKGFDFVMIKKQ